MSTFFRTIQPRESFNPKIGRILILTNTQPDKAISPRTGTQNTNLSCPEIGLRTLSIMIERKSPANKQQIISEYLTGNSSYNGLEIKYGIKARTIQTWVRAFRMNNPAPAVAPVDDTADIKSLRKQLEEAQLKNELLEEMLRLSEEQTGLDLRKKFGTRQS